LDPTAGPAKVSPTRARLGRASQPVSLTTARRREEQERSAAVLIGRSAKIRAEVPSATLPWRPIRR
jgi:hypothetical protein